MPNSCSAIVDRIVKRVSSRCDLNTVKSPLCNNTDNGWLSTQQENDIFSRDNPHFQGLTNCSYAATAHIASRARTLWAYDCLRALERGPEWVRPSDSEGAKKSQCELERESQSEPEGREVSYSETDRYRDRAIVSSRKQEWDRESKSESERARMSQQPKSVEDITNHSFIYVLTNLKHHCEQQLINAFFLCLYFDLCVLVHSNKFESNVISDASFSRSIQIFQFGPRPKPTVPTLPNTSPAHRW